MNFMYNENDKWTKRDTLLVLGLHVIVGILIAATFFIGRALGIPEFMF